MDITINTPALLFPAISLIMLAYTNRFMALSSVVRKLHDEYQKLVRRMQFFGVMSFLMAILCMYLIFIDEINAANIVFAISILLFSISLVISLIEILRSTNALELELEDMEEHKGEGLTGFIKKNF
ncbi:MAG: DUF2721 domain-containing protein [Bacteroidetes bacterium]|nr:DUF2721 domain-containing protein [Bacteroidota bacterium]